MSEENQMFIAIKNSVREQVRKEVLQDELGALTMRINELNETIHTGLDQIGQVLTNVPSPEALLERLAVAVGNADVPAAPVTAAGEEEEEGTYLQEGEIAVDEEIYNNVLDFVCAHSILQKCFIERRPVHGGIRAQYTGDCDPQITIAMRSGAEELGVDNHMRTVWLTLKTDSDEAYIRGEYWERFSNDSLTNSSLPMSPDQITRIIQGTLRYANKTAGRAVNAA